MKTKFLSLLVALTLVFSACNKDKDPNLTGGKNDPLGMKGVNEIVWNGASDRAVAANIAVVQNDTRKNASGIKITSNAHSADFPGLYFIWDYKQPDNGYLKVDAKVFENYAFFILTAKESNTYWDFAIVPQIGQKTTTDGYYVFFIPKVYNNKNINMVFISELRDRINPDDPPIIVNPPIIEKEGDMAKYVIISNLTQYGAIVDSRSQWLFSGVPIKDYWNNTLIQKGYGSELNAMTSIQTSDGVSATWIWDRDDSWEHGISGSLLVKCISEFDIDGDIVEDEIPFYFACDNAAVLFVNGQRVAFSEAAFQGRYVPSNPNDLLTDCSDASFDGEVWQHIYTADIKGYLVQGYNSVVIMAANSDSNDGRYDKTNNPAGLIFASQFSTVKPAQ